ncbi:MAG: hypothetical protein H7A53_05285 [Akkermansiaceae bacterium]|nr:hypothetical protein [Akkermansiaceae bacterium]
MKVGVPDVKVGVPDVKVGVPDVNGDVPSVKVDEISETRPVATVSWRVLYEKILVMNGIGNPPTQAEMEAIVAKEIERLGARPSWAFATEPCGFYSLG